MAYITIETTINAPIARVWEKWTSPEHIQNWNFASPDWHCPSAKSELQAGGEFHYEMASKDGSMSFDFWGTFQQIEDGKMIASVLGDGRKMQVTFETAETGTKVTEQFEPENQNPEEMQKAGWQMILDNFKSYVESAI
ncbi:MAG: SRPBCC domain-containing protein [Aquirufa sp.]